MNLKGQDNTMFQTDLKGKDNAALHIDSKGKDNIFLVSSRNFFRLLHLHPL